MSAKTNYQNTDKNKDNKKQQKITDTNTKHLIRITGHHFYYKHFTKIKRQQMCINSVIQILKKNKKTSHYFQQPCKQNKTVTKNTKLQSIINCHLALV